MKFSHTLLAGAALLSLSACQTLGLGGAPELPSPTSILLAGVDVPDVTGNLPVTKLSASNPICLKFYENTASFVSIPMAELGFDVPNIPGAPSVPNVPTGPSFGSTLVKTLVLGTLSGVVGGGVSALGIESTFLQSALAGTASQVTYNLGDTVYDNIVGGGAPDPSTPEGQAEIAAAAAASHDVASHTHDANGNVIPLSPAPSASTTSAVSGDIAAVTGDAATAGAITTPLQAIEVAASQLGCPSPDAAAIAALKVVQ